MSDRNTYYGRSDNRSLYHFNPFHDRLGRFASSRSGSTGGYTLRYTQKLARAQSREREKESRVQARESIRSKRSQTRAVDDPRNMSTKDLQEANKRAAAVRKYEQNYGDNRLETARTVTNEATSAVNRLRNSNREAMAQEQRNRPRMDLSHMTDQQLRERINRENLERQYNQLFNDKPAVSRGRQQVDAVLEVTGDVLHVAETAVGLAILMHTLKNRKAPK